MTRTALIGGCAALVVAGVLAGDSAYVVAQGYSAVLTRPGAAAEVISPPSAPAPGLYLKWPWLERAERIDRRIQVAATTPRPVQVANGARLDVRALVAWQVVDPLAAVRAGGEAALHTRLDALAGDAIVAAFRDAPAADLLNGRGDPARQRAAVSALDKAAGGLGVRIVDLSLTGASLPAEAADAAGETEQADLSRAAAQVRADGEAARQASQGETDREIADIRGEGEAAVLRTRGQGDATRADILGAAYDKDPAFAAYLRRLDAYDSALSPATTTLVLSPDSNAFLSTFGHGPTPQR